MRTKKKLDEPEPLPIDFCITLDNSGSMGQGNGSDLQKVKDAAKDFVGRRNLSMDRFGVVRFDSTASKLLALSNIRSRICSAIDSIGSGGSTDFAPALAESADVLRESAGLRKKVVLFFTDGGTSNVSESLQKAQQLRNSGIIICAVATEDADRSCLTEMTENSDLVIIARGGDIANAFKQAETAITDIVCRY
ncbi:hypothetical protein FACS18942_07440 [Planctomycetales bacterium]|nr:hypothetical protein FACS18942_07440 [Planctomycetales bacterium]